VDDFRFVFSYAEGVGGGGGMGHMRRAVEWERKQWAKQAAERAAVHPVYLTFTRGRGWLCEFVEESNRATIRRVTVASPEKVREMATKGGALSDLASKQALEHGIESGRGGVTLKLTADQLASLKGGRS
jgi:hypothetical protein